MPPFIPSPSKGTCARRLGSEIEQDYTFAFETAPEAERDSRKYTALFYNKMLYDFSPSEQLLLPFYLYMRDSNLSEIDVNTSIYAYRISTAF